MSRGPRGLTPAERALWDAHTRRYTPLDQRPATPRHVDAATAPPTSVPQPTRPFRIGERAPRGDPPHDLAPPTAEALMQMPLAMDRKRHRAITRGRTAPEGRLDLHGMTLDQAHPALMSFVQRAHADGRRLLLVITGKGGGPDDDGAIIPRPRGVLRRQVPAWLSQPPLSGLVQQVVPAHRRHGGEGAYYVYLRRRR